MYEENSLLEFGVSCWFWELNFDCQSKVEFYLHCWQKSLWHFRTHAWNNGRVSPSDEWVGWKYWMTIKQIVGRHNAKLVLISMYQKRTIIDCWELKISETMKVNSELETRLKNHSKNCCFLKTNLIIKFYESWNRNWITRIIFAGFSFIFLETIWPTSG